MPPGWHADPTQRHHYRWWDGVEWSDQVSDFGVVSTDSGPVPGVSTARSPGRAARPDSGRLVLLAAAVGIAVVVTGVFVALFRDSATGGFGVSTGQIERRGRYSVELVLEAGDIVRVRAEPEAGLDVQLGVVIDRAVAADAANDLTRDHAKELTELYPQLGPPSGLDPDQVREVVYADAGDFFTTGAAAREFGARYLALAVDDAFDGGFESGYFVAEAPGTYTLVAAAVKGVGEVRVVVERADEPYERETYADAELFATDPFFTDDFYTDDDPFQPGA